VIVVYKVDRLTRSLADFAKMVEIFDAHDVSFVAVTQQFNTTTSMGRLTLNVLLSFAQFEREVTGERIRDKIAASKQKGMWMGGTVPLGYDARDHRLVVNPKEAATVRLIFRLYIELRSVVRSGMNWAAGRLFPSRGYQRPGSAPAEFGSAEARAIKCWRTRFTWVRSVTNESAIPVIMNRLKGFHLERGRK
jgi:DNA invertase Pin-like site-specific DNA recombinase